MDKMYCVSCKEEIPIDMTIQVHSELREVCHLTCNPPLHWNQMTIFDFIEEEA